ncbi:MAG: hypothetical protein OXR66_03270 [Candidatus Woesearchaeota archaeon]|nr:hypothetical protein [Candidatus Woesearchaeota archaeon]
MDVATRWREFVAKAIYPVGLASPLLTFVQAGKIFLEKDAAGVSLLAWAGYLIIAFFWLNYGMHNRLRPMILVESFAIIGYILIVVGAIMY